MVYYLIVELSEISLIGAFMLQTVLSPFANLQQHLLHDDLVRLVEAWTRAFKGRNIQCM